MNTDFNTHRNLFSLALKPGIAVLSAMLVYSCIQGPWEYRPEKQTLYKGIWTTGYVIAELPVEQVCFDRFHELDEKWTKAFPFYQTANVTIAGSFTNGNQKLTLQPRKDSPNCFEGDSASLPIRGESYLLEASFKWDSAGTPVETNLSATANIPDKFVLKDTAVAPGPALEPPQAPAFQDSNSQDPTQTLISFFNSYPPEVQDTLEALYLDTISSIGLDTNALQQFFFTEIPKINKIVSEILASKYVRYTEGDTVFYLSGAINTFPHFYSSDFSQDVAAVLITQKLDSNYGVMKTSFSNFTPDELDTADFYNPGFQRRLHVFPNVMRQDGLFILDSIGIVNSWFVTGKNSLYFYGVESAYQEYIESALEGEQDSRIEPKYNIDGAAGIFSGAIKDSFVVYIKAPPGIEVYPQERTLAAFCREEGFDTRMECRKIYESYCASIQFGLEECSLAEVIYGLKNNLPQDSLILYSDSVVSEPELADLIGKARKRICVQNNFPDSITYCQNIRTACIEEQVSGDCKMYWFDYCVDHSWKPESCAPATELFCQAFESPREICRAGKNYCQSKQEDPICRE